MCMRWRCLKRFVIVCRGCCHKKKSFLYDARTSALIKQNFALVAVTKISFPYFQSDQPNIFILHLTLSNLVERPDRSQQKFAIFRLVAPTNSFFTSYTSTLINQIAPSCNKHRVILFISNTRRPVTKKKCHHLLWLLPQK